MNLKFPWTWGPANLLDWTFNLNQRIPIVLEIISSSEQAKLDLGDLQITELTITTNASSMLISLPAHAGQTLVNIQASSLSLQLRVPSEVGAHFQANQELTGSEIDLTRFTKTKLAGEYRSPNYETAANRADVHLDFAGGSVKIV
jgi:hypothetical protein